MVRSFTLSVQAADILGEDLRLNLRRFPFEIPSAGATDQERARIRESTWADLRRRDLVDDGELDPDAESALRLLNSPHVDVAITSVETDTERLFRARVAVSGRAGVCAIQDEESVRVEFVDPRGLARICTGLLPDVAAGRLESATLSTESAGRQSSGNSGNGSSGGDSWLGDAQASATRRAGGPEMRKVQQILALPTRRIGYLFVTGRDGRGEQVRPPAIGWRDTDQGRYSVTTRRTSEGVDWNTFAGADKQRLAGYLAETLKPFQQR